MTDTTEAARRDLKLSLALLGVVVASALIGLAADHNWPKMLRVSLSFLAYAALLLAWLRSRNWPRASRGSHRLPFYWFASAGATAGIVSGLVRPRFEIGVLAAGTLGAALLLGGVHWMALAYWRRVRAAVTTHRTTEHS